MRILHTSDWHLGQKLCNLDRHAEHEFFLEHLLRLISENEVDCLLHAGDIFDSANPPNSALSQYYRFLYRLTTETNCQQAILVGGNHDSISTLQAPQLLLEALQIHVIGGAPADPQQQLIQLKDRHGEEALICAVPFLRDSDLRSAVAGEGHTDRQHRLREGIRAHYARLAELAKPWKARGQFVGATGHLFAANTESTDSEKEIHLGLQERFPASDFPALFDYVALGHLHRPQRVGGTEHIRYSGSPLPLSFSERDDQKVALLLHVEQGQLQRVEEVPLQAPRRLTRLRGTLEEVCAKLHLHQGTDSGFEDWVEVRVELDYPQPHVDQQVQEAANQRDDLRLLQVRVEYTQATKHWEEQAPTQNLDELQPTDVFREVCAAEHLPDAEILTREAIFREMLDRFQEESTR